MTADTDFYRNWIEYKVGFDDPSDPNFWRGTRLSVFGVRVYTKPFCIPVWRIIWQCRSPRTL